MSSLVLELQQAALNPANSIADLLRMAMVVATKLQLEEMRQWCDAERRGYQGADKVPDYRRVHGQLKAWNRYNGWIPVMMEDEEAMEVLTQRDIGQAAGELEKLLEKKDKDTGDTLKVPLPHHILMRVFGNSEAFRLGMMPTLLVGSAQVHGILEAVRNTILDWSLDLERQGIIGDGMTFSPKEVEKAAVQSTYNIGSIGSFNGVMGPVTESNVQVGNYNSIHKELKRLGVPQDQRNDLEEILDELPTAEGEKKKSLVRRAGSWLARNGEKIGRLSETVLKWVEHFDKVPTP